MTGPCGAWEARTTLRGDHARWRGCAEKNVRPPRAIVLALREERWPCGRALCRWDLGGGRVVMCRAWGHGPARQLLGPRSHPAALQYGQLERHGVHWGETKTVRSALFNHGMEPTR